MDIKEKAREQLNWLGTILHKIPGSKDTLRGNCAAIPTACSANLSSSNCGKVKSGMNKVLQAASREKDFDLLREHDLFVKALERAIDDCRYADQGYSGFFDLIKIREAELDKVYDLDAPIAEIGRRLSGGIQEPGRRGPGRARPRALARSAGAHRRPVRAADGPAERI